MVIKFVILLFKLSEYIDNNSAADCLKNKNQNFLRSSLNKDKY